MGRNIISEAEGRKLARRRKGETEKQHLNRVGNLIERFTVSKRNRDGSESVTLRKASKPRKKPMRKKGFGGVFGKFEGF